MKIVNHVMLLATMVAVINAPGVVRAKDLPGVAVSEFNVQAGVEFSKGQVESLHSHIISDFQNTKKFTVLERKDVKKLMDEIALGDAGLTKDGPQSNEMQGAKYAMYGEVILFDVKDFVVSGVNHHRASLKVQLRITDIESSKMLVDKIVDVHPAPKTDAAGDGHTLVIEDAITKAAQEVVFALVEYVYPFKVVSVNSQFVTVNIPAEHCKKGDIYELWELGDEIFDPDTGESLGCDEELVGKIIVSRPGKVTKCVCDKGLSLDKVQNGMVLRKPVK